MAEERLFDKADAVSDLAIKTATNKVFYAHRQILSQYSSVLMKQWGSQILVSSPSTDGSETDASADEAKPRRRFEIMDWSCYEPHAVLALLRFMYPPHSEVSESVVPLLLALVVRYEMRQLHERFEQMLLGTLRRSRGQSRLGLLALGCQAGMTQLIAEARELLIQDPDLQIDWFLTSDFAQLPHGNQVELLIDRLRHVTQPAETVLQEQVNSLQKELQAVRQQLLDEQTATQDRERQIAVLKGGMSDELKALMLDELKHRNMPLPAYMHGKTELW